MTFSTQATLPYAVLRCRWQSKYPDLDVRHGDRPLHACNALCHFARRCGGSNPRMHPLPRLALAVWAADEHRCACQGYLHACQAGQPRLRAGSQPVGSRQGLHSLYCRRHVSAHAKLRPWQICVHAAHRTGTLHDSRQGESHRLRLSREHAGGLCSLMYM